MRGVLLLTILVAGLALPAATTAHNTSWHWSRVAAQAAIIDDGIEYDDGDYLDVTSATCFGRGTPFVPKSGRLKGYRLYKHFFCRMRGYDSNDDPMADSGTLHVTGQHRYVWS